MGEVASEQVSNSHLQHSGCIADDVGELEDVGSELLLHVTQEQHCILTGESANVCHCKNKITEKLRSGALIKA